MTRINGNCYEIRERLKAFGGEFSREDEAWYVPDDRAPEAQGLADVENRRVWLEYLGTLAWANGEFTTTTWNAALRASSLFVPMHEAIAEIAARVRAVKSVGDSWFLRNVGRAYAASGVMENGKWKMENGGQKKVKPVFQEKELERVASISISGKLLTTSIDLAWLADRSPVEPFGVMPCDFLSALYEPGEYVVVFEKFESQGQWMWRGEGLEYGKNGFISDVVAPAALYETKARPWSTSGAEFTARGPKGVWYLCNPVSGEWEWLEEVSSGDDAHWSRRFHACVTSWRYMVIESDKARALEWVAAVVQLPLRIVAIYTSGGKSVHVLIRLDAGSKREWDEWRDEIKPIVVPMGADEGCMSAVRLTRLPGCFREEKGRWQKLLYLNPGADMTPLESRPVLRDAVGPWRRVAEGILRSDESEIDPEQVATCRQALEFYASVEGVTELRKGVLA